jgi:DNA (cytosine-5)-methyltransferase 3A
MEGIKVLSLFDGISCARVALDRIGVPVSYYYSSEIDKYAIQIAQKNYPDTIQLGDIKEISLNKYPEINNPDLIIGGSPCQDLSIAKKDRKGLEGERSGLFWEYVRILKEVHPKYFILENVASMSKKDKEIITQTLGVEPVMINASLVSAQNRKRSFWVGKKVNDGYIQVEIPLPEDRGILLKDILENGSVDRLKSYCIDANYYRGSNWKQYKTRGRRQLVIVGNISNNSQGNRVYSPESKSTTLSANGGGWGAKTGLYLTENIVRKLTPIECERLQGLPDNYTEGVSNTQRYKALGNAFNVDVVAHILKYIF